MPEEASVDINAVRDFVQEHPNGVEIVTIDGTRYTLPHRDYIWFTPAAPTRSGPPKRFATSFYLNHNGSTRLVNALLVEHIREWKHNGQKRRKSA